jgi:hypothetical protein
MTRLWFKILKCQSAGCKEKATHTWAGGGGWFCDMHLDIVRLQFDKEMQRIWKEGEREEGR